MNKNFVRQNNCPYCSHKTNSAINELDEYLFPMVGDISICIQCGEVSEFDEEMELKPFNVSTLGDEDLYDIRHKQLTIAKIRYKESKLQ